MIMMTMTVMIILLQLFYFAVNGLNCPYNHNQKQCSWTALQGEVYWKYMDSWTTDSKTVLPTLKGGHIKKISYRPKPSGFTGSTSIAD